VSIGCEKSFHITATEEKKQQTMAWLEKWNNPWNSQFTEEENISLDASVDLQMRINILMMMRSREYEYVDRIYGDRYSEYIESIKDKDLKNKEVFDSLWKDVRETYEPLMKNFPKGVTCM
jgi:hypothetical protein